MLCLTEQIIGKGSEKVNVTLHGFGKGSQSVHQGMCSNLALTEAIKTELMARRARGD